MDNKEKLIKLLYKEIDLLEETEKKLRRENIAIREELLEMKARIAILEKK